MNTLSENFREKERLIFRSILKSRRSRLVAVTRKEKRGGGGKEHRDQLLRKEARARKERATVCTNPRSFYCRTCGRWRGGGKRKEKRKKRKKKEEEKRGFGGNNRLRLMGKRGAISQRPHFLTLTLLCILFTTFGRRRKRKKGEGKKKKKKRVCVKRYRQSSGTAPACRRYFHLTRISTFLSEVFEGKEKKKKGKKNNTTLTIAARKLG